MILSRSTIEMERCQKNSFLAILFQKRKSK